MAISKHRIGRRPITGPLVHAFDIEWDTEIKAPKITNEDPTNGPNSAETRAVYQHFMTALVRLGGGHDDKKGIDYDSQVVIEPGSAEHFNSAVYQIPRPFMRMPS